MKKLKNSSIRVKLGIVGGLPMILLFCLGVAYVVSAYKKYSDYGKWQEDIKFTKMLSSVIGKLQVERGMSATYASGGVELSKVGVKRTAANEVIKELLENMKLSHLPIPKKVELERMLKSDLIEFRTEVNKGATVKTILSNYTGMIKTMLNYIKIRSMSGPLSLSKNYMTILILENAKENSGKLRANLSSIIAKDAPITSAKLSQIVSLYTGMSNNLFSMFLDFDKNQLAQRSELKKSGPWKEVGKWYNIVLDKSKEGSYAGNGAEFFKTISIVVNEINALIIAKITATQESLMAFEAKERQFMISISLGLLFFTFLMVSLIMAISKMIIGPTRAIRETLSKVSIGDLSTKCLVDSLDEIGKAALDLNNCIDQLASQEETMEASRMQVEAEKREAEKTAQMAEQSAADAKNSLQEAEEEKNKANKAMQEAKESQEMTSVAEEKAKKMAAQVKKDNDRLHQDIARILEVVKAMASGDLTQELVVDGSGPIAELTEAILEMEHTWRKVVTTLKKQAGTVLSTSTNLQTEGDNLHKAGEVSTKETTNCLNSCQTVAVQMEEVKSTYQDFNASIQEINQSTSMTVSEISKLMELGEKSLVQMNDLDAKNQEISSIVKLISGISGQTNLLALNATIEAARAGEHGKGFAVVANEVKELANQTESSSVNIINIIQTIQDMSTAIKETLNNVVKSMNQIKGATHTMAASVEEQTITSNEIAKIVDSATQSTAKIIKSMGTLKDVSEKGQQSIETTKLVAGQMDKVSKSLAKQVENFRV